MIDLQGATLPKEVGCGGFRNPSLHPHLRIFPPWKPPEAVGWAVEGDYTESDLKTQVLVSTKSLIWLKINRGLGRFAPKIWNG